jgi:hypothetical protein
MGTTLLTERQATAMGRRKIRNSQLTAFLIGGLILASGLLDWSRWPLGLLLGLIYANAFEYFTHRVLLHGTAGYLHQGHERHHVTWGHEDEALYVRFGPPVAVVGLFVGHSLPLIVLDRLGAGIGAGALAAFVVYYSLYEEFHWRIHLGYLPSWLGWMRKHHFAHHKGAAGKFNVLVPLGDWLLNGQEGLRLKSQTPASKA